MTNKLDLDWVFNFNSDTKAILRQLAEGISTRIYVGRNSMLSFVHLQPNREGNEHSHPEEQWGILLEGSCIRKYKGNEILMEVGDFWYTAPNENHSIKAGNAGALILDVFSPPRSEYKSSGKGFGL